MYRRDFIKNFTFFSSALFFSHLLNKRVFANEALKILTINIAKVTKTWDDMSLKADVPISFHEKKGSATELIEIFSKGNGTDLYDAVTDNGGNQEDILSKKNLIETLDISKIKNWQKIIPEYKKNGKYSSTIRNERGDIVGVPYLSNTDSLAYNKSKIGEDINTWEALFDSQFKGYASIQNSLGPTITITAIYLKQTNKQDIKNPSNMTKDEIKGVCEFLINMKKRGQFKKIWDNYNDGVRLLANEEVLVSSCWEPIAISAKTKGVDIKYGVMKEGHLAWNNVWMFTKGGQKRGQEKNFYKLMNLYLTPWFGLRLLDKYGFTPQIIGMKKYINDLKNLDTIKKQILNERLVDKQKRMSIKGNSWQNLYPNEIVNYQDWWQKFLAA
tara:strand:+ start:93 stop:1247 length:1155 start_codon:yes stop_codon:yes gene_type:complete